MNGIGQPRGGFCTLEESGVTSCRTVKTGYLTLCPKSQPALNTARARLKGEICGRKDVDGHLIHYRKTQCRFPPRCATQQVKHTPQKCLWTYS